MSGPDLIRVLVADDHEAYRHELRETLERDPSIRIVAQESNGADAVHTVFALRPDGVDLVLMDIDMPVMNGIEATREIAVRDPALPIIILTVSTLDHDLLDGIDSGAVGFLNKNLSPAALVRALRDFRSNGSLPMSRIMAGKVVSHLQRRDAKSISRRTRMLDNLSWREREILMRIAAGAHDHEIAAMFVVAETTIKTHVRHILRKLGARNRAEAVARLGIGEST